MKCVELFYCAGEARMSSGDVVSGGQQASRLVSLALLPI